ncbi:MAG: hypothetical protein M1477_02640 [Candidatus Thermoplasmatota archaeon]|nr:hypothetical protein [Candidatus Thermoplasmatota archaeon]MCL5989557.1 hypothetical protein [Candidatus Thermoplasmatota archaeon]
MGKIEFDAQQKNFGSPFVVAYDEVCESLFSKSSVLLQRKIFKDKKIPKSIKVIVEWADEEK